MLNNTFKLSALALASLLLASCGGGTRDHTNGIASGSAPTAGAPSVDKAAGADLEDKTNAYRSPTSARFDEVNLRGFYDVDAQGGVRAVRNDLEGSLPAMVQFAQSHTVDPNGNEAKNMPRLTTERAALLLVTPDPSLGEAEFMTALVSVDGVLKGRLEMLHPNAMYRSDYNNGDGRPDYVYSRRSWSVHLPWDWVKPGMSISVSDGQGRTGTLAAAKIDFGAPAELVVHNIRLGMLTDPHGLSDDFRMQKYPAQGAADYFQTIPAARMTVAQYEPARFDRVMVANGTIYNTASAGEGGVYAGDMRENTGKSTVSVGINLANFGATASGMASQEQPQLFQNVVVHHAVGLYSNGRQSHGLSGGNGMLTLYASRGNEFSHEIGHHYGLGHFPGEKNGNRFWAGHHHDSGWGYIEYRKRMRANLHWGRGKNDGMAGQPVFEDTYAFGTDSMAGGHYSSSLSQYAHYTGYSTKIAIQPNLNKPVPSASSPTGYLAWNATTRQMEPHTGTVPNNARLFFNSADGRYLKPRLVGAPVFTVLGGYNPDTGVALLYPALRGNWGNVFDLPTPQDSATSRQCWLQVGLGNGQTRRIAVAGKVLQGGSVNKLHVNLAQADHPQEASLQCQEPGAAATTLATMSFPQGLAPMDAPVVIGKEAGYTALRAVELPRLDTLLTAASGKPIIHLGAEASQLVTSWGSDPRGLSSAAQQVLTAYRRQEDTVTSLNRWINRFRSQLQAADNTQAVNALKERLSSLGLLQTPLLPAAQSMRVSRNQHCVTTETVAGQASVYINDSRNCAAAPSNQWMMDARGAIRSVAHPAQCLTSLGGNGTAVTLSACDRSQDTQVFALTTQGTITRAGRCLDLARGYLTNGRGELITYNCSGGDNQKVNGLQPSDNKLLTMLNSTNLTLVTSLHLD